MTPTQREAALRLADDRPKSLNDDLYQWAIDAEDAIRELAAEPVQEPVAWVAHTKDRRFVRACWTTPPTEDQLCAAKYDGDIITPLYAAPQQRAPLDATAVQELKLAVSGKPYLTVEQLVRQVERLHGITGEPG